MLDAFLDWHREGGMKGEHQENIEKKEKVEGRVRDEKQNG